jgi:hypothetical protein
MKKRCRLVNVLCAALFVAGISPTGAAARPAAGVGQGQVVGVGILPLQNDAGKELPADFGQQTARELQQKLAAAHKDLLPRVIAAEGPGALGELVALGRTQGLKFIVRGGLLALDTNSAGAGMQTTAQLYAEVISVERGDLAAVRAEGGGGVPAAAISAALEQLAGEIHRAVVSPAAQSPASETDTGAGAGSAGAAAEAAEADDELMQLVAQAESLASSGVGAAETLAALSRALEGLKAALAAKAAAMERAEDTSQPDEDIAARRQELEAAIDTLAEGAAAAELSAAAAEEQPSGEKKGLLSSIDSFMGDVQSILLKIQEMRVALQGAGGEPAAGEDAGYYDQSQPAEEEVSEEVTGVVTEEGEPVVGAEVTEPESGVSATTDAGGVYTLKNVPVGRLAQLVVTKSGKKMASAQLNLAAGRAAVADFDLSGGAAKTTGGLRVIPSTVIVRKDKARAGASGVLAGVVRGAGGRPVARALVRLEALAVARTDSRGRYRFVGVPAGRHQLTVHKSGLRPRAERVEVAAKKMSASKTDFAAGDRLTRERLAPVDAGGTDINLRGTPPISSRSPWCAWRARSRRAGSGAGCCSRCTTSSCSRRPRTRSPRSRRSPSR